MSQYLNNFVLHLQILKFYYSLCYTVEIKNYSTWIIHFTLNCLNCSSVIDSSCALCDLRGYPPSGSGKPIGLYFLEIVGIVGIVGIVMIVKRFLGYGFLRLNNSMSIELILFLL